MSRTTTLRRPLPAVLTVTLLAASLALLSPGRAEAGAITVTRFDDPSPGACDPGDCSLREAIMAANVAPGANSIALQAGTYQLSVAGSGEDGALNGDLDISNAPLTIIGKGPERTIIDSGGAATGERTFDVHSELSLEGMTVRNSVETSSVGRAGLYGEPGSTLTLRNVVVSGHVNNSMTPNAYGSGINSSGTLNLTDVVSSGNTAPTQCCSGVFHYPPGMAGPITARNVTVENNSDSTAPGAANECCSGFFADTTEPKVLENVVSRNNVSAQSCCTGFFFSGSGPLTAVNLVALDNVAPACCSGIYVEADAPSSITNATVSGNSAAEDCCVGIYSVGASDLVLTNVTVSHNSARDCCVGIFQGSAGTLTVNNATVTNNNGNTDGVGAENGAGISNGSSGTVNVRNSISANNTVGAGATGPDCLGTITSQGYNLFRDTTGCTISGDTTGNLVGADPLLGPLQDNGGFGPTHALGKRSPAVGGGNPAAPGSGGTTCHATDQRGVPRKKCDIGAYELTRCMGIVVNRVGTPGKDKLRGTKRRDGMLGFGGKDTLVGKKGKDGLCGGGGKDTLKGGPGKDRLNGQGGKDLCVGGPGSDRARRCEREKRI